MPKMGMIVPVMGTPTRQPTPAAGLADTLFSATQQRVLGALFARPDRSFYASELIAASRGGSGAVQRELARLEGAGLIVSQRIGNQKHYQANPDSPIFEELLGIARKVFGAGEVPRVAARRAAYAAGRNRRPSRAQILKRVGVSQAQLATFCRDKGIARLSFFGSVTRDDFQPDSDVDVMAEFAPGQRRPGLFELVDLKDQLSGLFGGRSVDVLTSPQVRNPYRRASIQRDLTPAYVA